MVPSVLGADAPTGPNLVNALKDASSVLGSAWSFISSNPIIFGACCVGLLAIGVHVVRRFF